MDLALSATYFPDRGLSSSILYGCSSTVEETIIRRLRHVSFEAAHPLLLPGIFAELELSRHTKLVEMTINRVEAKIHELDLQARSFNDSQQEKEQRSEEKRDAWLELTYLRNAMVSWNTQLGKMAEHATKLNEGVFGGPVPAEHYYSLGQLREYSRSWNEITTALSENAEEISPTSSTSSTLVFDSAIDVTDPVKERFLRSKPSPKSRWHQSRMRNVGDKIRCRILAIKDEYDEKIRDCTTRVDGMAMATQWVRCSPTAN
jgi:hypothetical protein